MPAVMLFALAIASSLDSLGVGIAYGLSGTRVRAAAHFTICTVMMAITWTAVALGNRVSHFMPTALAHIASALIFGVVGAWILSPLFRRPRDPACVTKDSGHGPTLAAVLENPQAADADGSREIDFREAIVLGAALSLNNIGAGVSAGLIRLSPFAMASLAVAFNVVCLAGGHVIGKGLSLSRLNRYATALSGILMILVGLYQLKQ